MREKYQETRERAAQLRNQGKAPLCPDCFDKSFPKITCQRCGETFRKHQNWLDARKRSGREILCGRCQNEIKERETGRDYE